jgi:hypothetical protein
MKQFDLENDDKINSGFKIPEHYFEQFENKIMNQISEKEVKVISLFEKRKFWLSAVAAVFVVGFLTVTYLNFSQNDQIIAEDYLAYDSSITTEEIAEHLTDEDINKIEESLNLYNDETTNYEKEYLQ